jgi:hypothetical protein
MPRTCQDCQAANCPNRNDPTLAYCWHDDHPDDGGDE